ncbi:integrating conjugative element protein [Yersinia mollaretii]|uniref:Integrating conjugative element protein n=1 Tax=Yersinia mollaretii TaxID=33060 RepID=A0AA44I0J7_YERMO|nr:integrating conjugative element protein [Yersinia mollaretii]NIL23474.1 integrating conjugative element protein [Yersinia mollaretii]CNJ51025.1 integrating conjugative element protein%2C PFL_4711 family [Yersinia mollaretii]CNL07763.1 integrating conjugative element protein%2C PFL_4711 family [Yersinia mollaretii]CQR09700.1 integrating conjugative element protein%2C PFL_4711 family [Yersinia mollaretii]
MKNNRFFKNSLITSCVFWSLVVPAHAAFGLQAEVGDAGYGKAIKGAVSDNLFYSIGGGTVISQPPSSNNMEKIGLGISWNNDLMCGNFNLSTTVKNQLNGVTDGFKNMMGDVINGATGMVASLPAMIIQRANPGLYELLTNGVLQANVAFDKAQLNCQSMSKRMGDYWLANQWTQVAIGEEYQNIVSGTSDAVMADNKQKQATGKEGVKWIGGQKKGGSGQPAIKPTYDLAKAGYNMLNKQPVTSNASISDSSCHGSLCQKYKTSTEAAEAVVQILGDRAIRTCAQGPECGSGGLDNESGTSTPGRGFSPMLEETTAENMGILIKLVNGSLAPNSTHLMTLKTGDLTVTRGVIQALKDDPDNGALVRRLAGELAMADTVSTALAMRRMLVVGQSEPYAAGQKLAMDESDRRLAFLDREITALKNEMEIRKSISSNTILTAITRQEAREVDHGLHQNSQLNDKAVQDLSKSTEE